MPTVPADSNLARERYVPVDPAANQLYRQNLWGIETAAAWMVTVWLVLAFMLMLGFSYSYFWTASTMIYLLMRRAVDETEMDEIYIEEDLPDAPLYPPSHSVPPPSAGPDAKGVTSLPTVTNPTPPPSSTLPMVSEPTSPPAPPVPPQGADTPRCRRCHRRSRTRRPSQSRLPPEPSVPAEKPMPAEPPVADEPTEDEEPTEENTAPDDDDDKKS